MTSPVTPDTLAAASLQVIEAFSGHDDVPAGPVHVPEAACTAARVVIRDIPGCGMLHVIALSGPTDPSSWCTYLLGDLAEADLTVGDVLAEFANIVAGLLKSSIGVPTLVGIPQVDGAFRWSSALGTVLAGVTLAVPAGPVSVMVVQPA